MILLSFHSVEKTPTEIERLNNLHSGEAMLIAVAFSILGEMSSLPDDLDVFRPAKSSKLPPQFSW